ncbi:MAG: hypothetical protein KGS61_16890, partial [Verrucomicrobia bacterium]|nr:hypothetical protein [Verrucomicrobiota bacterium]
YVGGSFTSVRGVPANNVVGWSNGTWYALGPGASNGVNGTVRALACARDGSLYVGGQFDRAGGVFTPNAARWDGTNWLALGGGIGGGVSPAVYAVAAADDGQVYFGGTFTSAGGVPVNNIAAWDGAHWHNLGEGISATTFPGGALVKTIAVSANDVYVGGQFDHVGNVPANCVARWDGQQWSALGDGVAFPGFSPAVDALAVRGSDVFVGGDFSTAGNVSADHIARWNGQVWSALGSGSDSTVQALAVLGGNLFAAGNFNQIGGQNIIGLAQWDGAAWSALGSGLGGQTPYASLLAASGRNLFVIGRFASAGGKPAASSAIWILTNAPPTIRITTPGPGSVFPLASSDSVTNIPLAVDATDADGSVTRVDYFAGNEPIGTATNAPFDFTWTNVPAGQYQLFAQATDNQGMIGVSPVVHLLVHTPFTPPTLSWITPTNGARFTAGDTIPLAVKVTDPDNTITQIDFNASSLGTIATLSRSPYQFNWTNAPAGDFSLSVAQDGYPGYAGFSSNLPPAVLPPPLQIHVNARPTVAIVSPRDGAVAYTTNALTIEVQAGDVDGSVTQVGLFQDGRLIATADSAPYEFQLLNLPAATNVYTAQATDNEGATATSAPVTVFEMAEPPSYYAPQITLISPSSNTLVTAPTNLTLVAQVSDLGAAIREVNFGVNNSNLGTVTNPPFAWTITNIAPGSYTFSASVTDANGRTADSAPVPVTVLPNPATTPAITLISPTNGATIPVGVPLSLTASVVPHASTVDRLDFYVNNNRLGSITNAPYAFTWQPSVVGTACWQAVAVYDQTQSVASAQACLNVALTPGGYPRYVIVDLGPLATNASIAYGVNSAGHLVGLWQSGAASIPFIDAGGVLTLLNQAPVLNDSAGGINDSDQVTVSGNGPAYIYSDGQLTNIGSLGGSPTYVRGINNTGQAVGDSRLANGTQHAFLYSGQRMIDLGALPGGSASQANAISGVGEVTGWSQTANGDRAFVYDPQHGMQAIPGSLGGGTYGWGINNEGSVVGNAGSSFAGTHHAFLSQNGGFQDLGTLGDAYASSYAQGVNDSNIVVGYSDVAGTDQHAFLWQTNVLFDLNDL